eukprot:TRINITY_DN4100_c0_g1_i3.p1 TRINITY_DN4100_c0_g1~~TRINITY_DN4100_c0_g1_i3.p1  ORF type:complete len:256 (+),score=34.57 TRINITY_DN4100_c0_g1_i3:53-769(+)
MLGKHSIACRNVYVGKYGSMKRRVINVRAEAVKIPSKYSKVSPKADNVLVKVAEIQETTLGGVLLPSSAQTRPTTGEVKSLGDGKVTKQQPWSFTVKEGDSVLYSKFGFTFTELDIAGDEYILIREQDIIGVMPKLDATADDIGELKPISDRVLVKVDMKSEVSSGGVLLTGVSQEKPQSGTVVRVGPGKVEEDGSKKPMNVQEGDRVVYFKYAGDDMETTVGSKFIVVHQNDILCKA